MAVIGGEPTARRWARRASTPISAVTETAFAERRHRDWNQLDALTYKALVRGLHKLTAEEVAVLSPLYRDVCCDLSRAQAARYSAPLVDYLQDLTAAAHSVVYGPHAGTRRQGGRAARAFEAFPRAVRAHWRAMLLAALLFFVPLAAALAFTLVDPTFAFRVVPEAMLRPLAEAYAEGFDKGRDSSADVLMAGFYVNNNVGIALRCFALGIFGGVLTGIYLLYNGLAIGATLGYVISQGAGENIVTFIVGHGSFELGAIVLAGGAGLSLGWSIVAPGERTRLASLQAVARDVFVVVCGAAVMLLFAAAIEGFWSGSSVNAYVKRTLGGVFFLLVLGYLMFVGRRERA